jgi:hypothetical protein
MPAYRDNPFDVNNHSEVDLNNYYDDAVSTKVTAPQNTRHEEPVVSRNSSAHNSPPLRSSNFPFLVDRFPSFLPCFRETTPLTNLC